MSGASRCCPKVSAVIVDGSRFPSATSRASRCAALGDLLPRSIIERDNKRQTLVVASQILGFVQQRANIRLKTCTLADNPHAHAIGMQRCKIVADETPQQTEQIADLACRPRPVLLN